jgi:hypothetical protein
MQIVIISVQQDRCVINSSLTSGLLNILRHERDELVLHLLRKYGDQLFINDNNFFIKINTITTW